MTDNKDGHQPTEKADTKPPSITTTVHKPGKKSSDDAGSLKDYMRWFEPEPKHILDFLDRLEEHIGGRWSHSESPEGHKDLHFVGIHDRWDIKLIWTGEEWQYNELLGSLEEAEQHKVNVLHIARMWQIDVAGGVYEREAIELLIMMLDGRTSLEWYLEGDNEHPHLIHYDDYGNANGRIIHEEACWNYVEDDDGEFQWSDPEGFEDRRKAIYKVMADWTCGVYYTVEGVDEVEWRLALDDFTTDYCHALLSDLQDFFGGNWYCMKSGPNIIVESRLHSVHGDYKHTLLYNGEKWRYKENQKVHGLDPEKAEWREKVAIDLAVSGSCRVAKAQSEKVERKYDNKHLALLIDRLNMKIGGDWKIQNQWKDLQIHTFRDEYRRKLTEQEDGSFRYVDVGSGLPSRQNAEEVFEVIESWREACELPRRAKMIERARSLDEGIGGDWRVVGDAETEGYAFKDLEGDANNKRCIIQNQEDGLWTYIEPTGYGSEYERRKREAHYVIADWGEETKPTLLEGHSIDCEGLPECEHPKGIKVLRAYKHKPECSVGDVVGVCRVCGETQCIRDVLLEDVNFEEHVSIFEARHIAGDEPTTHEGYSTKKYLHDKKIRELTDKFPAASYIGKRLVVVPKTFWDRVAPSSRKLKILGLSYESANGFRLTARCEETHKEFNSGWSHIGAEPLIDEWYPRRGHTVFYNAPDANNHIETPIKTVEENTDLLRYCVVHDVIFYKKAGTGPYECSECNDS